MKLHVFLWERHLAAMIVAGSHSHKGDASLPTARHIEAVTGFLRVHRFWSLSF
jgi:hypothetical protein